LIGKKKQQRWGITKQAKISKWSFMLIEVFVWHYFLIFLDSSVVPLSE